MNEWAIVLVRLHTLSAALEAAYDHVCVIQGENDPVADAINRSIWTARGEIREAVKMARNLRDCKATAQEKEALSVQ